MLFFGKVGWIHHSKLNINTPKVPTMFKDDVTQQKRCTFSNTAIFDIGICSICSYRMFSSPTKKGHDWKTLWKSGQFFCGAVFSRMSRYPSFRVWRAWWWSLQDRIVDVLPTPVKEKRKLKVCWKGQCASQSRVSIYIIICIDIYIYYIYILYILYISYISFLFSATLSLLHLTSFDYDLRWFLSENPNLQNTPIIGLLYALRRPVVISNEVLIPIHRHLSSLPCICVSAYDLSQLDRNTTHRKFNSKVGPWKVTETKKERTVFQPSFSGASC